MTRALAMISGGLDSTLAAKLIKDIGIEVIGICFKSYFFGEENAKKMCKQIGIQLEVIDFSEDHFEMVKKPKYGWGKNMNPCVDCHAMMMRYSGELLKKFNADFIITGEVLNQRPMSQNKQALNIVRSESGFGDKILRPLCALNLEPTEMELTGLVDRDKLLGFSGRNRKPQIQLAKEMGITDYPSPASGCRLTEPNYSIRLKEALVRKGDLTKNEITLLRYGRHFLTIDGTKIIVSRNEEEGEILKKLLTKEDIVFLPSSHLGSMGLIHGKVNDEDKILAAKIIARYSKGKDEDLVTLKFGIFGTEIKDIIDVKPSTDEEIAEILIQDK
ncbi:tRNA 4-thiouridine(8) synthase ThiI [Clostridium vincentii]|uniref:tRNA-specific 2-thiouridylase MnmA n=1 Tax=Clostridium vincentii TaxID=52704 RepID=A0A2T0BGY4_9CLOT|nr:tRNA 4-thiouridine(8) synthase ThiI [Clostridium vincentii]PRR83170.1 tRNA-specific 2-thiouridylase MnmA [Clostridium vincentii]